MKTSLPRIRQAVCGLSRIKYYKKWQILPILPTHVADANSFENHYFYMTGKPQTVW
jgi:hypothetical protein